MKKILFILTSVLLFACRDENQNVYSYVIKNNTQSKITEVVIYYYVADINIRCNGKELSLKIIDADNTTKIIETNYAYISFFYSYNGTNSFYRFPASDNHYKLDANKLNTISIDDQYQGTTLSTSPSLHNVPFIDGLELGRE